MTDHILEALIVAVFLSILFLGRIVYCLCREDFANRRKIERRVDMDRALEVNSIWVEGCGFINCRRMDRRGRSIIARIVTWWADRRQR
jgi:hypothetical protein